MEISYSDANQVRWYDVAGNICYYWDYDGCIPLDFCIIAVDCRLGPVSWSFNPINPDAEETKAETETETETLM